VSNGRIKGDERMTLYMETTKIEAHKTIGQIQGVLASYGASAILVEYEEGEAIAVSFKVKVAGREIPFMLPCRWEAVHQLLESKYVRGPRKGKDLKLQAKRVAWRQILKWVEAQMALVETEMVRIEEVFLPYAQMRDGKTLFETMAEREFKALPSPEE